ncbi:hypothetical protein EC957_003699 [Mortierella hygrophila]|uniref:DUF221-domain-containing protein n=1 Tax=Mortierella hygrophila TaxID=979708 RepID=A0A9P6F1I9_9FUNG|nr:hypothetical protein EC957_003699 [Mortierella hygrophila]
MAADLGEEQTSQDASVATFVSALLFNGAVGIAIYFAFSIIRNWNKRVYQPRTYLVNEEIRSPELEGGLLKWIDASMRVHDNQLVDRIGLDAYVFLRFLRMSAILFSGFTLIGIPILIPLNVINGVDSRPGPGGQLPNQTPSLTRLAIGNVADGWRLWFHLALTALFSGATIYMLWMEMQEYTRRRHAYLMSEKHAKTPQSTTILVTAIPKGLNTEKALFEIFNRFPGGVRSIWLNKNPSELIKLCEERDEIALKLEAAEYNYVQSAYNQKAKKDIDADEPVRPIGRTSAVPLVGPKVDLIEVYSQRLSELNRLIAEGRKAGASSTLNSAFIRFHNQFAAHSAVQTVVHPTPFRMAPMFVEVSPLDVVWEHLNLDTVNKKGRHMIATAAASALILLWTFPVLFVTGIANLDALIKLLPFLKFLNDLPNSIIGIIQGILPPLFLAILMAVLPIILTAMSKFEGHVRQSAITLAVMKKYYFFLVVNVLLLTSLGNGVIPTLQKLIKPAGGSGIQFSPMDVISILASTLPAASTFFVTYALLQGLTGPAKELLQIAPLVLNYLFTKVLAKSPRQIWNVQGRLSSVNYGTLFPPQVLMFSIGMLYSTIAPIILPVVAFYFTMFYFVYRHQFLYVYYTPVETGGLAFPVAVKQAFTGIFIFQTTIFGIFLLKQSDLDVIPHLIILILLIFVTAMSFSNMKEAFDPLVTFLPVALFSKDLKVNRAGYVTDGSEEKPAPGETNDEELAGDSESGHALALTHLPRINEPTSEKAHLNGGGEKQEYDEVATVSSQLPGVPTPNPSLHGAAASSLSQTTSQQQQQLQMQQEMLPEEPVSAEEAELLRLQEQAYCHPSLYSQQVPIWLPHDERGVVDDEITRLSAMNIVVATTGADMDPATGKTHVSGIIFAPGEETRYRLERGM